MTDIIIRCALALSAVIMAIYYVKGGTPIRSAFKGMISGALALAAAAFFGGYIGAEISVNAFSAAAAIILGVPGVLIMLVAEWLK